MRHCPIFTRVCSICFKIEGTAGGVSCNCRQSPNPGVASNFEIHFGCPSGFRLTALQTATAKASSCTLSCTYHICAHQHACAPSALTRSCLCLNSYLGSVVLRSVPCSRLLFTATAPAALRQDGHPRLVQAAGGPGTSMCTPAEAQELLQVRPRVACSNGYQALQVLLVPCMSAACCARYANAMRCRCTSTCTAEDVSTCHCPPILPCCSRKIAVDASMHIYQFLVVVGRQGENTLTNEAGEVTSHLQGMFYRTVRMLEEGG